MKIYTKTGDDGTTGLIGGDRVRKSDPRIDCYGTVDELSSFLGLAAVGADAELVGRIHAVQNDLFVVGAHLACAEPGAWAGALPEMDEAMIARLEMEIDAAEAHLPALRCFILPGGSETAARLHVARTVCRRAERIIAAFSQDRTVPPIIQTYLNRLSDWLFVHARYANHLAGVQDIQWSRKQ